MPSVFTPFYSLISDISRAQHAVVTFTADHSFIPGEYISLRTSSPYGMVEANNKRALVLSTTSDTATIDLDTSNFTPFQYPAVGTVIYLAMAVPSASGIPPNQYPPYVTLEDCFDNQPA